MGDKTRGLYEKFTVTRMDGTSAAGAKHDGCEYFVLDRTHDKFTLAALRAYAEACREEYPLLSADIYYRYRIPVAPDCSSSECIETIDRIVDGLAGQQAMGDDSWRSEYAVARANLLALIARLDI